MTDCCITYVRLEKITRVFGRLIVTRAYGSVGVVAGLEGRCLQRLGSRKRLPSKARRPALIADLPVLERLEKALEKPPPERREY
jgi:hypothetical protein